MSINLRVRASDWAFGRTPEELGKDALRQQTFRDSLKAAVGLPEPGGLQSLHSRRTADGFASGAHGGRGPLQRGLNKFLDGLRIESDLKP